jgi:hypothetical protein
MCCSESVRANLAWTTSRLSLVLVPGAAYGAHWLALAAQGWLFTSSTMLVFFPCAEGVSLGGLGCGFLAAVGYARWKGLPLKAPGSRRSRISTCLGRFEDWLLPGS